MNAEEKRLRSLIAREQQKSKVKGFGGITPESIESVEAGLLQEDTPVAKKGDLAGNFRYNGKRYFFAFLFKSNTYISAPAPEPGEKDDVGD